jgi:mono/diheme cytochrome c family protein
MYNKFRFARIVSFIVIFLLLLPLVSACSSQAQSTEQPPTEEIARPSNPGGPGDAVNLTGDAQAGAEVYKNTCAVCHGEEGKGGIQNPGSDDGTVPELNPIDPTLVSADTKTFATNIDLFIQNGSTPEGDNPEKTMVAWGATNALTQQQIADVIAYIISLNKQ